MNDRAPGAEAADAMSIAGNSEHVPVLFADMATFWTGVMAPVTA